MFDTLKRLQQAGPKILAKILDGQNPEGFESVKIVKLIEVIKQDHHIPGSMIVRHEDQPNGDFHFIPGSDYTVSLPNENGGYDDLVGVKLVLR